MSVQLLDKTRKINKLLHSSSGSDKVVFNDICAVLGDVLESTVFVLSRKGKILGMKNREDIQPLTTLLDDKVGTFIDPLLNERFLNILSTKENMNLAMIGFDEEQSEGYVGIAAPIEIAGERYGTLFVYRTSKSYTIDDIILCEYGTTVVGLEIVRSESEESAAELRRQKMVQAAINTLSVTELEALRHVFDELEGNEGILVASKIADHAGLTRSVIVNALRKMESAGVIESRSSGMRGTYIKVLNQNLWDVLYQGRSSNKADY